MGCLWSEEQRYDNEDMYPRQRRRVPPPTYNTTRVEVTPQQIGPARIQVAQRESKPSDLGSPQARAVAASGRSISAKELAEHADPSDAWVAVDGAVYNVSDFASRHPGGKRVLLRVAGTDATQAFRNAHSYVNPQQSLQVSERYC